MHCDGVVVVWPPADVTYVLLEHTAGILDRCENGRVRPGPTQGRNHLHVDDTAMELNVSLSEGRSDGVHVRDEMQLTLRFAFVAAGFERLDDTYFRSAYTAVVQVLRPSVHSEHAEGRLDIGPSSFASGSWMAMTWQWCMRRYISLEASPCL